MKIVLWGEKSNALKYLPLAKSLLRQAKAMNPGVFVQKWIKTSRGDLVGFRFLPGFGDSIFIRSLKKLFNVNRMCGDLPTMTLEACMAVDFWEGEGAYVSGVYTSSTPESSTLPLDETFPSAGTVNNCDVHRLPTIGSNSNVGTGASIDSLNATTSTIKVRVTGGSSGDVYTLQAFVWDLDDNVLATGTQRVILFANLNTENFGNDLAITYSFSKPTKLRFGAIVTNVPSSSLTLTIREITYTDADIDIDLTPVINFFGGATQVSTKVYFDTDARPQQLFVSREEKAITDDRNVVFLITNPPYQGTDTNGIVGVVFVYKYTLAGVFDSVFSFRMQTAFQSTIGDDWWGFALKLNFVDGKIRYEWMNHGSGLEDPPVSFSPTIPELDIDAIIDSSFLEDGFEYRVGYLKHRVNQDFSDGMTADIFDSVQAFPKIQMPGYDSWYGAKINTNTKETNGLQFPKMTLEATLVN